MNDRETILKRILLNKPEFIEMPIFDGFKNDATVQGFREALLKAGGNVYEASEGKKLDELVKSIFPSLKYIVSNCVKASMHISSETSNTELNKIELAILEGEMGVAENGAIFISEENMINRSLPFITQHLVLILEAHKIVSTMHEAYSRIPVTAYGVFIAGPSKTADIEQSLVIGAHGPKSLSVILT